MSAIMPAPWEPGYQPETRTLKQIKRDYHRSVRPSVRKQMARVARGVGVFLGIFFGSLIFVAICAGVVQAIGLVPALLLCLLWQGGERRA